MKVAFVFGGGRGTEVARYRSAAFRTALVDAGIDPLVIDVSDAPSPPVPASGPTGLACRERDLPDVLRTAAPALVQTFGAASALGSAWAAAADIGRPPVHFVQTARADPPGRRRSRGLSVPWRRFSPSRHVTAVLGSSRAAICRAIEQGLFPAARFSRVIAPPIELPAPPAAPAGASARATFGVYDPYGTDEDLRFVLQAIASSGHTDLFSAALAYPAYRIPPVLPRNVTAVEPGDPADFVRAVDALILPCDADHLLPVLAAALQAGRTVIVPDGGVLAELIGFGRAGVLFAAGSAYDLALKINIVTGAGSDAPFAFHGGQDAIRKCAPGEVARAFAACFHLAVTAGA